MEAILFDLDGSLLPMDQDAFVAAYFGELSGKISCLGYDAQLLIKAVKAGTFAMISNDGRATNENVFWEAFEGMMGTGIRSSAPHFEDFYRNEFNRVKALTKPTPLASLCVKEAVGKGYRAVLATNPIFPRAGTLARVSWAGLDPLDFSLITTYEDFSHSKPDTGYYYEVLDRIGATAEECLMAGNDVDEDMCASETGMDTYLIEDCLINRNGSDLAKYKRGSLADLLTFIRALPAAGKAS